VAIGAVLLAAIYIGADISGSNFNPAISFG
jgi:glycerol uptake facilitator-like aquaporin